MTFALLIPLLLENASSTQAHAGQTTEKPEVTFSAPHLLEQTNAIVRLYNQFLTPKEYQCASTLSRTVHRDLTSASAAIQYIRNSNIDGGLKELLLKALLGDNTDETNRQLLDKFLYNSSSPPLSFLPASFWTNELVRMLIADLSVAKERHEIEKILGVIKKSKNEDIRVLQELGKLMSNYKYEFFDYPWTQIVNATKSNFEKMLIKNRKEIPEIVDGLSYKMLKSLITREFKHKDLTFLSNVAAVYPRFNKMISRLLASELELRNTAIESGHVEILKNMIKEISEDSGSLDPVSELSGMTGWRQDPLFEATRLDKPESLEAIMESVLDLTLLKWLRIEPGYPSSVYDIEFTHKKKLSDKTKDILYSDLIIDRVESALKRILVRTDIPEEGSFSDNKDNFKRFAKGIIEEVASKGERRKTDQLHLHTMSVPGHQRVQLFGLELALTEQELKADQLRQEGRYAEAASAYQETLSRFHEFSRFIRDHSNPRQLASRGFNSDSEHCLARLNNLLNYCLKKSGNSAI